MNRKIRWVPAKSTLGQNQFVTAPPVEPQPTSAEDGKALTNGLFYGGMILAGLTLAWLVTRKG